MIVSRSRSLQGQVLLLGFYLVLLLGTYPSVTSCFRLSVFGKLIMFLDFGEVAFCRTRPMLPSSAICLGVPTKGCMGPSVVVV